MASVTVRQYSPSMVMQGRQIGERDIDLVRSLLEAHPDWNRTRLSRELCARWAWHNAQGRPKDTCLPAGRWRRAPCC
jgi:hypothetical protein